MQYSVKSRIKINYLLPSIDKLQLLHAGNADKFTTTQNLATWVAPELLIKTIMLYVNERLTANCCFYEYDVTDATNAPIISNTL